MVLIEEISINIIFYKRSWGNKIFLLVKSPKITIKEDYYQITQKGDYLIKVFKGFLKSNYCSCPHCNSKNIVKNGSKERNIKFISFQNYNVELNLNIQRHICKDCKKTFSFSTSIAKDNSNNSNISNS